ncbi:SPOR domain-containing protein [Sphingobium sp. OAS761]|uniref:SPOR domain-containing protein n=1 Tax=Sphingobium sp. OAS761 TaxID=2817901 RepID=UPI00209EBA5D|nr:SPOR domain-containing protein [Sphingobium sp. OAS761]
MADYARGGLELDDEDRLPWLEPAMEDEAEERISPLRLLGLILLGLVLVGAAVGGIWWLQNRDVSDRNEEGVLIEAPAGDYKVAANEADARKFEGEGDASFAASEGVARDGKIDLNRVPEAPVTGTTAAARKPDVPARAAPRVNAPVADETTEKSEAAPKAPTGGPMIQLGAYASASGAKDAWDKLARRFAYLAPLTMSVQPVEVGGNTLYRLRATAGAQAGTICGKLKVAGESCIVVN